MTQQLKPALLMLVFFTFLTGIAYPLLVTFGAQMLFSNQANGSLIVNKAHIAGSELIGQPFSRPDYFWGRPSATSPSPYNAGASSGSNQGPSNPTLVDSVKSRIATLQVVDPENKTPVPVDLIAASASGLDPHISPAAAEYQVNRIAKARKIDPEKLRQLMKSHIEGRLWGLLGEPRVNVLKLNLALVAAH
ncbi:potassium-transporting ATPase subunit KdpC [Methyloglobulus sp.]|uniref:potassium-transporting ATPase subunit KdpC n=1 Tax=Methyloglobulus sp. TaxID=2518622 RepID=UPI0032B7DE87